MTKHQEWAVERIRRDAIKDLFFMDGSCEFKKWVVTEYDSFVSVVFEVGRKDDEGTMAAILCRDRGHVFVGKRGGITYPVYVFSKHKSVTRQYKTAFCVCYEQKHLK